MEWFEHIIIQLSFQGSLWQTWVPKGADLLLSFKGLLCSLIPRERCKVDYGLQRVPGPAAAGPGAFPEVTLMFPNSLLWFPWWDLEFQVTCRSLLLEALGLVLQGL